MKILDDVRIFADLRERRFARFFVIYCIVAWVVLQFVDQLADRGVLPELVYRVALTVALCAAPGALIVTWFHGEVGHQRMPRLEKLLLGLVAVFTLGASTVVTRSGLAPAPGETSPARAYWEDPRRVAVL
jgi:hypothetical protein